MIYAEYWGLESSPFGDDLRPRNFIPTHSVGLALARLRYSLGTAMGASALFGDPGVGKTRVAKLLVDEFREANWLTAYLPRPCGTAGEILAKLIPGAVRAGGGQSLLDELERGIVERAGLSQPTLLVVDDVHTAKGTDFLELLRTLLNLEYLGKPAISVLLAGQSGMDRKLNHASGFDTRLAMRAVLEPMTAEETRVYILARLKAAGSKQGIFTRQAAERVVVLSRGVPRQVNRLCELALVVAYGLGEMKISPEVVDMAAADLDMLPPEEVAFHPWPHPEPEPEPEPETPPEEDILATLSSSDQ